MINKLLCLFGWHQFSGKYVEGDTRVYMKCKHCGNTDTCGARK